jgi:hypothetical protein
VNYCEIIADNLSKAGWSLGWVSALDLKGRTIWIADAHRDDGKRFIVRTDEMLTAFVELQRAIHQFAGSFALINTLRSPVRAFPYRCSRNHRKAMEVCASLASCPPWNVPIFIR